VTSETIKIGVPLKAFPRIGKIGVSLIFIICIINLFTTNYWMIDNDPPEIDNSLS
jgi:hypothetical protein